MRGMWRRQHLGSEADRATFRTLHRASLASPALREGLTRDSAERSVRHLRVLLGTPALALTDTAACLAWDGTGDHHETAHDDVVDRQRRHDGFSGRLGRAALERSGRERRDVIGIARAVPRQRTGRVGDRDGGRSEQGADVRQGVGCALRVQPTAQRGRCL